MLSALLHNRPERLVIVTGPPRGGTTVVGEVLGYAPRTATLHEPMNADTGDRAIGHQFEVPGTDGISEADFAALVDRALHRRVDLRAGMFRGEPLWRRTIKAAVGSRAVISQRRAMLQGRIDTLVWKDPFAVFALDAIQQQVPGSVAVYCYRPPLALAASFKRMKWRADCRPIMARLGMDATLSLPPGADPLTPVASAALLWRMIFGGLADGQQAAGARVLFDIDRALSDPVGAYGWLYAQCGMPFADKARARIAERYRPRGGGAEPTKGTAHVRNRDVASVNSYWRSVLDEAEIDLVRGLCDPLEARIVDHFLTPGPAEAPVAVPG